MPLDEGRAVSFVEEYRKYLQFQSTLEILTNPPEGYLMPPTDLLGGLDEIQVKAAIGFYSNQYDFDTAISDLVNSAYDGHLAIRLCSLHYFGLEIDMPLVSISSNGTALPQVYAYSTCHSNPLATLTSGFDSFKRRCFATAGRVFGFSHHFDQRRRRDGVSA